jgi:Protein of unknown function (DUF2798)
LKIEKKYRPYLSAIGMGLSLGLMMSFVMTWVNVGMTDNFLLAWGKAYLVGISIGIPTAIMVAPFINTWAEKITE